MFDQPPYSEGYCAFWFAKIDIDRISFAAATCLIQADCGGVFS